MVSRGRLEVTIARICSDSAKFAPAIILIHIRALIYDPNWFWQGLLQHLDRLP